MMCVSSTHYSVLLDNSSSGMVFPGRGLRKGDHLSPYLYILCTGGLSSLIKNSLGSGHLHGIKICRGAPIVSHLLFADDSFLFFRANEQEAGTIMDILHKYELASGQAINLDKSEIMLSRNVSQNVRSVLVDVLGVQERFGVSKYLGLPSMIGRNKIDVFHYVKDRIWKKVGSWKGKLLSMAGKEILIKSVAQSIPSYCMSTYLIPPSLSDEIKKMLNSFWWGSNNSDSKGIKWLSWDKLLCQKCVGVLVSETLMLSI